MQGVAYLFNFALQLVWAWFGFAVLQFLKLLAQGLGQVVELLFQTHHPVQLLPIGHFDQEENIVFQVTDHSVVDGAVRGRGVKFCLRWFMDCVPNLVDCFNLLLSNACQTGGNVIEQVEVRLREPVDGFSPVANALGQAYDLDQGVGAGGEKFFPLHRIIDRVI